MVWISVEGSIGSGKSELINGLRNDYNVHTEDIEEWKPYLKLYYDNPNRYSFLMMMEINYTQKEIVPHYSDTITERSPYTSCNIFAKMFKDRKIMSPEEFSVYQQYALPGRKPDYYIYLKATPETCYNRIIKRGDDEINLGYLYTLERYHEQFINSVDESKVFIIDAEETIEEVNEQVRNVLNKLNFNVNL